MGHRELQRVPLDFDWQLGTTWQGYLNPYYVKCTACNGSGATPAAEHLENIVHLIMIAGECSLKGTMHPWLRVGCAPDIHPSKDMAELTTGLAGRPPNILGHDSCDRWSAARKIIIAAGLDPDKWGVCPDCLGSSISREFYQMYREWKPTEPPDGQGYQLWETTSEGSPVSPIFKTAEELAIWCELNATAFGSSKLTKDQWLQMFNENSVESGTMMVLCGNYFGAAAGLPPPQPQAPAKRENFTGNKI